MVYALCISYWIAIIFYTRYRIEIFFTVIVLLFALVLIKASFYNLDYYLLEKFLKEFDVNVISGKATLEDYQKLSVIGKRLAYNILSDNKNFKLILEDNNITELNDSLDTKLIKKEYFKEKVQKI